jgi:hypothetical protein
MAAGHFKGSQKRHGGAASYPGWIISPAAPRPLAFKNPGRCRMSAGIRLLLVPVLVAGERAWLGLSSSKDDATAAR